MLILSELEELINHLNQALHCNEYYINQVLMRHKYSDDNLPDPLEVLRKIQDKFDQLRESDTYEQLKNNLRDVLDAHKKLRLILHKSMHVSHLLTQYEGTQREEKLEEREDNLTYNHLNPLKAQIRERTTLTIQYIESLQETIPNQNEM